MDEEDLKTEDSKLVRVKDTKEAQKILTSSGPAMLIVYAKWCGHCRALFDIWRELSNKISKQAKIYVIEESNYKAKDINGFPSMRIMKNGKVTNYEGERDVTSLEKALLGNSFGGRRRRTRKFRNRIRKIAHRSFRRNIPLI
jgi:thiol-disulfide isomerase/thioredoxin